VNYRASALGRVVDVARVLVFGEFFEVDRENTKMSQNVGRLRKASSIKKLSSTESRSNKIKFFRQKTASTSFPAKQVYCDKPSFLQISEFC